jgi:two-component sensor histidine kinase
MNPVLSDTTLLMRELTHRISNEFASAVCMLSVAASRCADARTQGILDDVQQHLESYARVHRALQMPELGTTLDLADYLSRLCESVGRSKLDSRNIRLVLGMQPMAIAAERCWMVGMIVNELITNATRHAFTDEGGTIRVGLVTCRDTAMCIVSDNGRKPRVPRPSGGLKIINALTDRLEGSFCHRLGTYGSTAILSFPLAL